MPSMSKHEKCIFFIVKAEPVCLIERMPSIHFPYFSEKNAKIQRIQYDNNLGTAFIAIKLAHSLGQLASVLVTIVPELPS